MNERELNEIWKFVEEKIHCAVPAYFKSILKACGYDNVITIASINEEDVRYFEEEVRNGKVSKYYEGKGPVDILDGSLRTESTFEFTRGHKKLLIFIADYLKNNLKENGSNTFTLPLLHATSKKILDCPNRPSKAETKTLNNKLPSKYQKNATDRDVKLHQGILTCEVIMSLINTTPTLFVANMESINNKIAHVDELFKMTALPNKLLEAIIYCPVCTRPSTAFQKWSNDSKLMWNVSNFVDHLNVTHQYCKVSKYTMSQVKDQSKWIVGHINDTEPVEDNRFNRNVTETSKHESVNNESNGRADECTGREKVQFPHTIEDDVKHQSYSDILKEGMASPKASKSQCLCAVQGPDEMVQSMSPQVGNYVVCLLYVKDTMKWPSGTNTTKNFVGKICGINEGLPNGEHVDESEEMFNIQFLFKKRHSNFIFFNPDQEDITQVSKSKIVKILPDPVQNRRGALVFKDKFMNDCVF